LGHLVGCGGISWRPLISVLLAAATLRAFAALVGGGLAWGQGDDTGERVGNTLLATGGFADGQGVALLLLVFGFIWFRNGELSHEPEDHPCALRLVLITDLRWLGGLFWISAIGAALIIVGNAEYYAGYGTQRLQWSHYLSTGGFSLAYLIIDAGAAVVCGRLVGDIDRLRSDQGAGLPLVAPPSKLLN
jgi:hypothetical protein